MEEFSQYEASVLSGYDERTFRSLVDKRIILASPATRHFGRGKAKTFTRAEVRVATVLRSLDLGLSPFQQAGITDWLRQNLESVLRTSDTTHPEFVLLEFATSGDAWSGKFETARGTPHSNLDGNFEESADRLISILINDHDDGEKRPMRRFIGANLRSALAWDDDKTLAMIFQKVETDPEAEG